LYQQRVPADDHDILDLPVRTDRHLEPDDPLNPRLGRERKVDRINLADRFILF
jgi:hypothetical protein